MEHSYQPSPNSQQHTQSAQHTMTQAADLLIQAATTALRDEAANMHSSTTLAPGSTVQVPPPPSAYPPEFSILNHSNFVTVPRHILNSFVQQQSLPPTESPQATTASQAAFRTAPSIPSATGRTWDPSESDRPAAEKFVEQNAVFCKACKKYRQFRKDQANIGNKYKSRRFRCCSCMSNYLRVADIMASMVALETRTRKREDDAETMEGGAGRTKRQRVREAYEDEHEHVFTNIPAVATQGDGDAFNQTPTCGQSPSQTSPLPPRLNQSSIPQAQQPPLIPFPNTIDESSANAFIVGVLSSMRIVHTNVTGLAGIVGSLLAENHHLKTEIQRLRDRVAALEHTQHSQSADAASATIPESNPADNAPSLEQPLAPVITTSHSDSLSVDTNNSTSNAYKRSSVETAAPPPTSVAAAEGS